MEELRRKEPWKYREWKEPWAIRDISDKIETTSIEIVVECQKIKELDDDLLLNRVPVTQMRIEDTPDPTAFDSGEEF
jgi:hypothetical protein